MISMTLWLHGFTVHFSWVYDMFANSVKRICCWMMHEHGGINTKNLLHNAWTWNETKYERYHGKVDGSLVMIEFTLTNTEQVPLEYVMLRICMQIRDCITENTNSHSQ